MLERAGIEGLRLRDMEVGVAQLECPLDAVLGPGLHEVGIRLRRSEGWCHRRGRGTRPPLRPDSLELLDEAESLLGDHDAVGWHLGDLTGPPIGPGRRPGRQSSDLGEDADVQARPPEACRRSAQSRLSQDEPDGRGRSGGSESGAEEAGSRHPDNGVASPTTEISAIRTNSKPPPKA